MPLIKGKSKAAFGANVSAEMHAGKPQKQALAIAYDVKRRSKGKKGEPPAKKAARKKHAADKTSGDPKGNPGLTPANRGTNPPVPEDTSFAAIANKSRAFGKVQWNAGRA